MTNFGNIMIRSQCGKIKSFVQCKELVIAATLHFGSMMLCGLIYILLPEDTHLRWGLTYWLIWVALLSPFALMMAARKRRWKLAVRLYGGLTGTFLWMSAFFLHVIGSDIFFPPTCFCKDGDYLARQYRYDFFDNDMTAVYKISGLTEKEVAFYNYRAPDSIKVYESLNAIVFYCPSEVVDDPFPNDTIGRLCVIEQLYDRPMESGRKKELERLSWRLSIPLGRMLMEKMH